MIKEDTQLDCSMGSSTDKVTDIVGHSGHKVTQDEAYGVIKDKYEAFWKRTPKRKAAASPHSWKKSEQEPIPIIDQPETFVECNFNDDDNIEYIDWDVESAA
tara:strand:+ start:24 stop:329 length:306 start_codon:yes stop_codon:yes gene_type:complete